MDIKLIGIDLDGTAFDNESHITDITMKAFYRAVEAGLEIVPITGRTYDEITWMKNDLPMVNYVCCCNGAATYNIKTGELVCSALISAEDSRALMDIIYEIESIPMVATEDGLVYSDMEAYERYHEDMDLPVAYDINKFEFIDPCTRLVEHGERLPALYAFYKDSEDFEYAKNKVLALNDFCVSSAFPNEIEINAPGVNKGSALLQMCEYLNIDPSCTMAAGDGGNDIPMIETAALGVAMENAMESVKKYADVITRTNMENGLAYIINSILDGTFSVDENGHIC